VRTLISGICKCGVYRDSLERDHIIPRWKFVQGLVTGDFEDPSNIQYLCANCHKDKTREDLRGFKHSQETRSRLASTWTPERRKQTSDRMRLHNPGTRWNKGLSPSVETREKIRVALTGRRGAKRTEETKQKMRDAWVRRKEQSCAS